MQCLWYTLSLLPHSTSPNSRSLYTAAASHVFGRNSFVHHPRRHRCIDDHEPKTRADNGESRMYVIGTSKRGRPGQVQVQRGVALSDCLGGGGQQVVVSLFSRLLLPRPPLVLFFPLLRYSTRLLSCLRPAHTADGRRWSQSRHTDTHTAQSVRAYSQVRFSLSCSRLARDKSSR